MRRLLPVATLCAAIAAALTANSSARAASTSDLATYYIGVDANPTITYFASPFVGQTNPNLNRLTFLFNHANYTTVTSSHYHTIGSWTYSGDPMSPVVEETNGNNRLPEGYTGYVLELADAPVGSPYEGMLISGLPGAGTGAAEYGDLEWRMTDSIPDTDGYGPMGDPQTTAVGQAAYYIHTRSTQNFTPSVAGLGIELELVGLTPGLSIGDDAGNVLMDTIDDTVDLFDGVDTFTPTFIADAGAAPGVYSASFQLHDNSGAYLSSGTFHFDFSVAAVPEPSTALLGIVALAGLVVRRR